jgi:hypothetical protein
MGNVQYTYHVSGVYFSKVDKESCHVSSLCFILNSIIIDLFEVLFLMYTIYVVH